MVKNKKLRKSFIILIIILTILILFELSTKKGSAFKSFLYNSNEADKSLKIATVAFKCDQDPAKNCIKLNTTINKIKNEHPEIELIVFSETVLGWFYKGEDTKKYHQRIAESIPGKTTKLISLAAIKQNVHIAFGLTENYKGKIFNSLVVINPSGKIIKVQRKKNIKNPAFSSGETSISFIKIKGIKTGLVICYDMQISSTIKAISKNKPELIIFCVAEYADEWDKDHSFGYGYLAKRLNSWLIWSNRVGHEGKIFWDGFIGVSNPVGDICKWTSKQENYIFYDIGFVTTEFGFKNFFKNVYMKISIGYHIIKNFNTAIRYVNNGAPLSLWMY